MSLRVVNPWTGDELATVPWATAAEAERAVARAVEAFAKTRITPRYVRSELLEGIATRLVEEKEAFAALLSAEAGKPIAAARVEVDRAVTTFRLGAEVARTLVGEQIPLDGTAATVNVDGYALRAPRGPILGISPFNFPLNLVAHKVAPALAVGAPIVLKPAPQTPLTALKLGALVSELAPETPWLQVVPCEVAVAEQLVADPRFAYVTFTGSDAVGWKIKENAGKKPVCLELGGNAAAIVHSDLPDRAAAVRTLVASAFGYAGQTCIKVQRLFLHEEIAAPFLAEFVAEMAGWTVADPADPATKIGPVIDARAGARITALVAEAVEAGARVEEGPCGSGPAVSRDASASEFAGNRIAPQLLDLDPVPVAQRRRLGVVTEEIFGPVVVVERYRDFTDAIARVNASRYGLQAAVFTDSNARIYEAIRDLHVGGVVVNDAPSLRLDGMPYGGVKDSGLGREGVRAAALEMTETKMVLFRRG
jgi:acyl-CoA reductase-like NAD-dependent aldehyde dehydrogenase